jgi:hypothetical protein
MIEYNTKDAAIGPHTLLKNLSMTNSIMIGNMGQQGKWGMEPNSTTVFTNDIFVGNCFRMSEQLPGAAQNFNQSTGLSGSYLTNFCRASGTVFDYFADVNSSMLFANNTIVTDAPTVFDFGCQTTGMCNPYVLKNNIFLGYSPNYTFAPFNPGSTQPGLYYLDAGATVAASYNIEYGIRNGDSCSGTTLCVDPLFVNEPAQGSVPPESTLDNFNFLPVEYSPAVGAGTTYNGLPSTDYHGVATTTPPVIGAMNQ